MFSEAMSSISSRWRPSSRAMASATSGSVSASDAVNRFATSAWARDGSVIGFTLVLRQPSDPRKAGRGDSIPHPDRQAMGADAGRLPTSRGGTEDPTSRLDDDVVVLDPHRHGFGNIGAGDQARSRLDLDGVAAGADAGGIAPRLAGADVEFPAVPGAADNLARAGIAIVAGPVRYHEPGLLALKQAAAAVRAAVVEGEELAAQIEHDDRAAIDLRELARAGRNVADRGDHVLFHTSRAGRAPWRCRNRSCC